jgi:hypothetical protein
MKAPETKRSSPHHGSGGLGLRTKLSWHGQQNGGQAIG